MTKEIDYRQIFYRCKHCGAVNNAHELNSNNHQCYYCGYGDFAPASLRYDRLTPVEIAEFVKELVDSDWWTEEIYAKLSDEIQERLKRMGRLSPWIPRTYPLACTLASNEILRCTFEQYLYGELDLRVMQIGMKSLIDLRVMQKEAEEKAEAIADKE